MKKYHHYFVYMMQSPSRYALYIGLSSNIEKRVFQHKNHRLEGYSAKNNTTRLVLLERYSDIRTAIDREKQLKRWVRAKKDVLIARSNPGWLDLAEDWGKQMHVDDHGRMWPLLEEGWR